MSKINPLRSQFLCANGGPKKCRVTCSLCRQIEMNDDEKRKTATSIRIPKVSERGVVVLINRSNVIETKRALKVTLKAQIIEGVKIPQGLEIWIPGGSVLSIKNRFSSSPSIHLEAWKINPILKSLYIDQLRHG